MTFCGDIQGPWKINFNDLVIFFFFTTVETKHQNEIVSLSWNFQVAFMPGSILVTLISFISRSILRHALDKIAEIKSLLEERRIGMSVTETDTDQMQPLLFKFCNLSVFNLNIW